ncbi:MAG: hypothetical protein SF069_11645 [Phycisphaerae bacterium]|nr:hypothetical protein [Phycisphaerae bacterium]
MINRGLVQRFRTRAMRCIVACFVMAFVAGITAVQLSENAQWRRLAPFVSIAVLAIGLWAVTQCYVPYLRRQLVRGRRSVDEQELMRDCGVPDTRDWQQGIVFIRALARHLSLPSDHLQADDVIEHLFVVPNSPFDTAWWTFHEWKHEQLGKVACVLHVDQGVTIGEAVRQIVEFASSSALQNKPVLES